MMVKNHAQLISNKRDQCISGERFFREIKFRKLKSLTSESIAV